MLPRTTIRIRRASTKLWGTWAVLLGVFAVFKGENEWYAHLLEVVVWILTPLAIVASLFGYAPLRLLRRAWQALTTMGAAPRCTEGPKYVELPMPDLDAAERESRARGLPDARFLTWKKFVTWLARAQHRLQDLPFNEKDGLDEIIAISAVVRRALPSEGDAVFGRLFDLDADRQLFLFRQEKLQEAVDYLAGLRTRVKPWDLSPDVGLGSFDQ